MNDYSHQYTKLAADQPIMYHPGTPRFHKVVHSHLMSWKSLLGSPPFYVNPMTTVSASSPQSVATAGPMYYEQAVMGSPDSFMSGMSPSTPPSSQPSTLSHKPAEPPMLVASSSASTTASAQSSSVYLNQTIAKASSLPESFYPEFLQYSKESFEQSPSPCAIQSRKKRRCTEEDSPQLEEESSPQLEEETLR